MKRVHLALIFCPSVLALVMAAASCSDKQDTAAPLKSTGKHTPGKDAGTLDGSVPDVNAPALQLDASALADLQKEVKTIPEALDVILTAYDIDDAEAKLGKAYGNTPPLQAYSHDLADEIAQSRARLKALYQSKDMTPKSNMLSGRLQFQSQAAEMNLTGIFRNMFNTNFAARRVQAEKDFLNVIESQLQPVMESDPDFKAEINTIHEEVSKREDRATALQEGVNNGTADGMFAEPDPPVAPQAPKPTPAGDAGP